MKTLKQSFFLQLSLMCLMSASYAQENEPLYLKLDFMKSQGSEYAAIEQEIYKPFHEQRIQNGTLVSWTFYEVAYGDRTEYDYVTAQVYRGLEQVGNEWANWEETFAKAHPGKDISMIETASAPREIVRSELWELVSEAEGSSMAGHHVKFHLIQSRPGKASEYREREAEFFTVVNEEMIKQHPYFSGHKFFQLLEPLGAKVPYDFAMIHTYDGRGSLTGPSWFDVAASAHPEIDPNDAFQLINGLRVYPAYMSETWNVLAHVSE